MGKWERESQRQELAETWAGEPASNSYAYDKLTTD